MKNHWTLATFIWFFPSVCLQVFYKITFHTGWIDVFFPGWVLKWFIITKCIICKKKLYHRDCINIVSHQCDIAVILWDPHFCESLITVPTLCSFSPICVSFMHYKIHFLIILEYSSVAVLLWFLPSIHH